MKITESAMDRAIEEIKNIEQYKIEQRENKKIEQQSKFAELGKLAMEIDFQAGSCDGIFDEYCPNDHEYRCLNYDFCQKRAELLAEV